MSVALPLVLAGPTRLALEISEPKGQCSTGRIGHQVIFLRSTTLTGGRLGDTGWH